MSGFATTRDVTLATQHKSRSVSANQNTLRQRHAHRIALSSHVCFACFAVRPDNQLTFDFELIVPKADSALIHLADNMDPSTSHARRTRPVVTNWLPASVRFALVYILAMGLRAGMYTMTADVAGKELATISRDPGEDVSQVGAVFAWKLVELGCIWLAGYDCKHARYFRC